MKHMFKFKHFKRAIKIQIGIDIHFFFVDQKLIFKTITIIYLYIQL